MHEGQILGGRYRLISRLGRGGMGEVWRAADEHAPPLVVAVKGVNRDPQSVAENRRRLEREAETLAALRHPHIVPITDKFIDEDQLYLVMQYVEGPDLQAALDAGSLTEAAKAAILIDVLDALTYLHDDAHVLHRDLKPENVLLDRRGRAYVTDFGIARSLAAPPPGSAYVIGTPDYMAPEVRDGIRGDAASDIWSFGAVALKAFTGRKYYDGVPAGDFAAAYTRPIRAALQTQASQRPSASELLESFRTAQLRGGGAAAAAPTKAASPSAVARPASTGADARAAVEPVPRGRLPLVLAVLIVALLAIWGIAANTVMKSAPPPVPSAAPSAVVPVPGPSTDTRTPTPTETPTPTPTTDTPSPTDSITTPPPGPQWYYLGTMDYVDAEIVGRPGRCDGGCTGFRLHPESITGTMYPESWEMRMDGDGKKSTTTWNAYTKCTKLEATIGLSDNSQSVQARFMLEREGGATDDFGVLRTGQSKKISVDLTGTFRFTIVSYLAVPQTLDTTSASVWGDIRMWCAPLPTPQS